MKNQKFKGTYEISPACVRLGQIWRHFILKLFRFFLYPSIELRQDMIVFFYTIVMSVIILQEKKCS